MNTKIKSDLFNLQDLKYKAFTEKLIPTLNPDTIIGVRIPELRKFAKSIKDDENIDDFLKILPHNYYEENNLHAFLIELIKDFNTCVFEINRFLPYVDNWATCDIMRPKIFNKNTDKLLDEIEKWLISEHTYTVRFGIEMLMTFYLDDKFEVRFLQMVSKIISEQYYINMMIAWYFATALAKQWESTIPFIEDKRLSSWVHNKTIQKAVESYRITNDKKLYLRGLKIK